MLHTAWDSCVITCMSGHFSLGGIALCVSGQCFLYSIHPALYQKARRLKVLARTDFASNHINNHCHETLPPNLPCACSSLASDPVRSQQERLAYWQQNRRQLVSAPVNPVCEAVAAFSQQCWGT